MPNEWPISPQLLLGFVLTLSRVAGIFIFAPLPGMRSGFDAPRMLLSLSVAVSLAHEWPRIDASEMVAAQFALMLFQEILLGVSVGILVGFLAETFLLAFQIPALQAGYSYASTVDPNTAADSSVLQVISQLLCGLVFFGLGMHREVIRAVSMSLHTQAPGHVIVDERMLEALARTTTGMFTTALRLALPIVAMLLMVDLILALLSRLNSQLQLISMIFPLKMLLALLMFSWLISQVPTLYESQMNQVISAIRRVLAP